MMRVSNEDGRTYGRDDLLLGLFGIAYHGGLSRNIFG